MLLPDKDSPPPGTPPPSSSAELVQAIRQYGTLAGTARDVELTRIIQGVVVVASKVDAQQAETIIALERRVMELESVVADLAELLPKPEIAEVPADAPRCLQHGEIRADCPTCPDEAFS